MRSTEFTTRFGRHVAVVAALAAVAGLATVSYLNARGGETSFTSEAPPEEVVVGEVDATDEGADPGALVTLDGPRSQGLADDFKAAIATAVVDPGLAGSEGLLADLVVTFNEDVDSSGVPFERVSMRTPSLIIHLTRGPLAAPIPLYAIDPEGDVTTEVWPDGIEAAIRTQDSLVQIIFVKNGTMMNIRASGVGQNADAPLTVEKVRLIAQAMASEMA
jgi:hypothetical protein